MTKIFMVEMSIQVAVAADNSQHAHELVDYYMFREAVGDSSFDNVAIDVIAEIDSADQLKYYNWDDMCIPYGDTDGNTRLKEILK